MAVRQNLGQRSGYYNWRRPHSACEGLSSIVHIISVNNLLAHNSQFSIVTIRPNIGIVPAHNHIPPALKPEESSVWLEPDFPTFEMRHDIYTISKSEFLCPRD